MAAEFGFKIDAATGAAAKENAKNLEDISGERKQIELDRILAADLKYGIVDAHYRAVKLLGQLGAWKYLIPPIEDMRGLVQPEKYHKYDVYEHTMLTVKYASHKVRLAALMHDIGKPFSFKTSGNFHGHEKNGATMAGFLLGGRGLKYDKKTITEISRLVALHMYDMDGKTSESKVRIFVARNFDIIPKLVYLIKADKMATGLAEETVEEHRFERIYRQIIEEDIPVKLADLAIDGHIAKECGLEGEDIGKALDSCLNECILNPKLNNTEWLVRYLKGFKN